MLVGLLAWKTKFFRIIYITNIFGIVIWKLLKTQKYNFRCILKEFRVSLGVKILVCEGYKANCYITHRRME